MCFHWVKAPTQEELLRLTHTLSHRVARFLERRGLLERDVENSYLVFEQQEEDVMQQLYGHSVSCRAVEHAFDDVACFIELGVIFELHFAVFAGWDAGCCFDFE